MNFKKTSLLGATLLFAAIMGIFIACSKDNSAVPANKQALSVYLTDAPCNFDSVLIDIRAVEVKVDTSVNMHDSTYCRGDEDRDDDHRSHDEYGQWDTLAITPGVFNLLALRNGVDALLGTATLPKGTIRKIRLTLGDNNFVVVDSVRHNLNLFPGTNNYVYVKIKDGDKDDDGGNQSSVWLDFNVCASILHGYDQYFLRPFIKPFGKHHFGEIEGVVLPADAQATVKAYAGADTAIAIPEEDGRYKIRGLQAGTYSVLFESANGYMDTTINNVTIQRGKETKLPTITLHK